MKFNAHHNVLALIALMTLGLLPWPSAAHDTTIETNVSTSASTGGQTDESGTIITGNASTSVDIRTEINGQVIEPVVIEELSSTGEQRLEVRQNVTAEGGQPAQVETTVEVNGQPSTAPAAPTLDSPVDITPARSGRHPATEDSFFQAIWRPIAEFFTSLFDTLFKKSS